MKAIILAGGYATRIRPVSYYLNKHMWPVYDRPLIEFAIENLIWAGINDICIILGGSHPDQVKNYLGNGARYGASFTFIWQGAPRGIAEAVNRAEPFCGGDKFIVVLGDNIVEDDLEEAINRFEKEGNCLIFVKEVDDPERFGVAEIRNGVLISLEEKPLKPKSSFALVGLYGFDSAFFDLFTELKPSWRGEYELTDIISLYLEKGKKVSTALLTGAWFSCDTFTVLYEASKHIYLKTEKRRRRD